MISLTKLNGEKFVLNAELIKTLEALPHTVITLAGNEKLLVRESVEAVVDAVIEYRRRVLMVEPGAGA
jgi:flagellar protein FlbD